MNKQRTHPIAVVSSRTGLSVHAIRAWEKRYGAVNPARTEGNHRLYTEEDVERLLLLSEAVNTGRSIGQIAGLPNEELRQLIGSGALQHQSLYRPDSSRENNLIISENYIRECIEAVKRLDSKRLAETMYRSSVVLGHIAVIENVIIPLMHMIGDFWSKGTIRILHEHMASAVVRTYLGDLLRSLDFSGRAPRGVAATLTGERHELGALTAAVAAALEGWHIEYLGPNLPWEEIARAAELFKARVVMISIILPTDEGMALSEISKLRAFLPKNIVMLTGGHQSSYKGSLHEQPGVELLDSMRELRLRLQSISSESP